MKSNICRNEVDSARVDCYRVREKYEHSITT